MHKIVKGGLGWRALSAVIDFVIVLFVGLGLFALAQTGFMASPYGASLKEQVIDTQVESGLYFLSESNLPVAYEGEEARNSYLFYQDLCLNYYTVYLPKKAGVTYDVYWYNTHVLGLEDVRKEYGDIALSGSAHEGSTYWMYEGSSYDQVGVPQASYHQNGDLSSPLTEEGSLALLGFYYTDGSSEGAYYLAAQDLYQEDFFVALRQAYTRMDATYPLLVASPIVLLAFYLLVPLLFSHGETLGKKICHLAVINKMGFASSRSQIVLRQLPGIILAFLPFVFLSTIPAATLVLGACLLSYVVTLFTPEHKSLADYWAGTLVVDSKESLFYENLEAQEKGEREFQALMQKTEVLVAEGQNKIEKEKDLSAPNK
jgi:uncharacterized RDD family membrane protein YckC